MCVNSIYVFFKLKTLGIILSWRNRAIKGCELKGRKGKVGLRAKDQHNMVARLAKNSR